MAPRNAAPPYRYKRQPTTPTLLRDLKRITKGDAETGEGAHGGLLHSDASSGDGCSGPEIHAALDVVAYESIRCGKRDPLDGRDMLAM